jgi:hypothetical protein
MKIIEYVMIPLGLLIWSVPPLVVGIIGKRKGVRPPIVFDLVFLTWELLFILPLFFVRGLNISTKVAFAILIAIAIGPICAAFTILIIKIVYGKEAKWKEWFPITEEEAERRRKRFDERSERLRERRGD